MLKTIKGNFIYVIYAGKVWEKRKGFEYLKFCFTHPASVFIFCPLPFLSILYDICSCKI